MDAVGPLQERDADGLATTCAPVDAEPRPEAAAPNPPQVRPFVTATHAIFHRDASCASCDVCGEPIVPDDDDEGYRVSGSGLYLWSRGDDAVRFEEPALCPSCGTAIGMSALLRWSVEEDEG